MDISLRMATEDDVPLIHAMQIRAFAPLLAKYQDTDTNPACETAERVAGRIGRNGGGFHLILADGEIVGALCAYWREEPSRYWIGPIFVDPGHQGRGIAQRALALIEERYPEAAVWELATIREEAGNCHLYEKMGYVQTGAAWPLNERGTLIAYRKIVREG